MVPNSVDPRSNTRSYALAYYTAAQSRPNLTVLTAANVNKVILEGSCSSLNISSHNVKEYLLKLTVCSQEREIASSPGV